jgi:hypothetical protein
MLKSVNISLKPDSRCTFAVLYRKLLTITIANLRFQFLLKHNQSLGT